MKFCKYCKTEQPEENFGIAASVGSRTYRRQKQRRQEQYAWLADYKKTLFCQRCGFSDYRALDFHHPDPGEKDRAVADLASRGAAIAKIKKEIDKCIVLCANCHRIEHYDVGM